jgi:hypothetical protein
VDSGFMLRVKQQKQVTMPANDPIPRTAAEIERSQARMFPPGYPGVHPQPPSVPPPPTAAPAAAARVHLVRGPRSDHGQFPWDHAAPTHQAASDQGLPWDHAQPFPNLPPPPPPP